MAAEDQGKRTRKRKKFSFGDTNDQYKTMYENVRRFQFGDTITPISKMGVKFKMSKFIEMRPLYSAFISSMEILLGKLLNESDINLNSITGRVKNESSLYRKLLDNPGKYKNIDSVQDVAGIRIITWYNDEVDKVALIIKREFDVDIVNSVDRRDVLKDDQFGYASLHLIVKFSSTRSELPEYRPFNNLWAEIQIRSMVQHVWSEIQHDMSYKSIFDHPREFRRRLSRVAGLLEEADSELSRVRDDIAEYEKNIRIRVIETAESVDLGGRALWEYVHHSSIVRDIENDIMTWLFTQGEFVDGYGHIKRAAKELSYLGFKNISEIDKALSDNKISIISFASRWYGRPAQDINYGLEQGICLRFLGLLIASRRERIDEVQQFVTYAGLAQGPESRDLARELIALGRAARKPADWARHLSGEAGIAVR